MSLPAHANARARRRFLGSLLRGAAWLIALLALVPTVALAARPQAVELRGHGGGLGQITLVPFDDGTGYVAAERLAAVLKGTWKAKGTRATLTVGSRSAQFTRNDARVVVGGTSLTLGAPVRLGASGWLVPEDFLGKTLARLAPGVTSARVPPPAAAAVKPAAAPVKAVARPPGPGVAFGDLRLRSYPTFTRIVLETAGSIGYVVEPASGGAVRVRLRGLHVSGPHAREIDDGLVTAVRLEAGDGEATLRVTLDGHAGEVQHYALVDPFRVVIDIYRPKEPVSPGPRGGGPAAAPLQLIVLDAGHGGHDPGATGPSGLTEKEVVLDVTRRVARMVEETRLGVKVALTRSTDVFVPLRDRTNFANKQRADLFLSIHANAHPRSLSEGVETYFLSSEATDNEARQVAAIENGVVQLESQGSRPKTDALKSILWDLAQSEFQQESSVFAEIVQDSMTRSLQLVNRGVKQAGFYVLGGAAMPAILVEIGFLTNPKEEKKLASSEHRESVARAILAGITDYKRRYDQRMRTVRSEPAPRRPEPARAEPPAAGRGGGAAAPGGPAGGDEAASTADAVGPRIELPPLRRDAAPARLEGGARPAAGAPAVAPRPAGVAPRPPAGLE